MAVSAQKGPKKFERYFKGVANHRRVQILLLIAKDPGMILDDIVVALQGNMKTVAEHARRLVIAGLVEKSHRGRAVEHRLTPYGEEFVRFIERFPGGKK